MDKKYFSTIFQVRSRKSLEDKLIPKLGEPNLICYEFSGFYNHNRHRNQFQGKSFGASDGFPNFFETGKSQKKPKNDNEAFNNFEDGGFKPIRGPLIPNNNPSITPYKPPIPGTFRHHRTGPISLPNRRNLINLMMKKHKLLNRKP